MLPFGTSKHAKRVLVFGQQPTGPVPCGSVAVSPYVLQRSCYRLRGFSWTEPFFSFSNYSCSGKARKAYDIAGVQPWSARPSGPTHRLAPKCRLSAARTGSRHREGLDRSMQKSAKALVSRQSRSAKAGHINHSNQRRAYRPTTGEGTIKQVACVTAVRLLAGAMRGYRGDSSRYKSCWVA